VNLRITDDDRPITVQCRAVWYCATRCRHSGEISSFDGWTRHLRLSYSLLHRM